MSPISKSLALAVLALGAGRRRDAEQQPVVAAEPDRGLAVAAEQQDDRERSPVRCFHRTPL